MVKSKPILIDHKKIVDITKYWNKICGSCLLNKLNSNGNNANYVKVMDWPVQLNIDVAGQCGGCFSLLSEARKEGKPFYIV